MGALCPPPPPPHKGGMVGLSKSFGALLRKTLLLWLSGLVGGFGVSGPFCLIPPSPLSNPLTAMSVFRSFYHTVCLSAGVYLDLKWCL